MIKVIVFVILLALSACAVKYSSGSVNSNVRNYNALENSAQVKRVVFNCDFDKVARQEFNQLGDYCRKTTNVDYVSYFIPPDIQSTTGYREHIIQNIKIRTHGNMIYKHYLPLFGNDEARFLSRDMDLQPPTSFAVQSGNAYTIVLTKKDILGRVYIAPTLSIRSFKPRAGITANKITDYDISYQIPPYLYTVQYALNHTSELLGAPDKSKYIQPLTLEQKEELAVYNDTLRKYFEKYEELQDKKSITPADIVFPILGKEKQNKGLPSPINVPLSPAYNGKYLSDFLPPYQIEKIEIFLEDSSRSVNLQKRFSKEDIYKVIDDENRQAALFYKGNLAGRPLLRYTYTAIPPAADDGLLWAEIESLGLGYIYSDIAKTIIVDMYIDKLYNISELSKLCVNEGAFSEKLLNNGHTQETVFRYLSYLRSDAVPGCSQNQLEIVEHLPTILD
jgi:hypothetical protein